MKMLANGRFTRRKKMMSTRKAGGVKSRQKLRSKADRRVQGLTVLHTPELSSGLLPATPRSAEKTRGKDKLFFAQKFPRVARIL